VYRCQSAFDPDFTGVGHQPRGFDELMALYDHYVVLSSTCNATFMPAVDISGVANGLSIMCGIVLRDRASALTSQNGIMEDRNVAYKALTSYQSATPTHVRKVCNVSRFLGRRDVLSDPQLKGNASNNPAEDCYFQVYIYNLVVGASGTIQISIDIEYVVMLLEPVQPAES